MEIVQGVLGIHGHFTDCAQIVNWNILGQIFIVTSIDWSEMMIYLLIKQ